MPSFGTVRQMTYLPNGDLAIARWTDDSISRITPGGGVSVIASVPNTYGLELGPNGDLWAANGNVHRIDPDTGVIKDVVAIPSNAHAVNFNPEGTRMYVGCIGGGEMYYVDLDTDGDPIGAAALFTTGVGTGYHDGLAVDACGYLWVPDYWTKNFYRVAPDGTVLLYIDWPGNPQYGHGAIFGSAIGGWKNDAIYAPLPYSGNTVKVIHIGVPGKDWGGIAINLPPALP